ncbi:MAG: LysM domain-containing protein [Lachnospiraceae bacterium]|nr:LysM domain-containing protein [Lachnospiraceae bacterium]
MDQGMNIYRNQYITNRCNGIIHVVKEGDSLYKIGKMHGVSVSALMYANPYVNVYNLQIGDELCVPVYPMQQGMGKEPVRENQSGNTMTQPNMAGERNTGMPMQNTSQNPTGFGQQSEEKLRNDSMQRMSVEKRNDEESNEKTAEEKMIGKMSRLEYEITDDSEL